VSNECACSVMAVVTVADFDGGLDWYERFFGPPADRARWTAWRNGTSPRPGSSR
jgi:hypothetical protein